MSDKKQARLVSLAEATRLIEEGRCLSIAGDQKLLEQLPPGQWIAGSIPYFMTEKGGGSSSKGVFINDFSQWESTCRIKSYSVDNLDKVMTDAAEHGFSLIIIPGGSEILATYARNAPTYEDMFIKPIVGWVSGHNLKDENPPAPIVMNGIQRKPWDNQAVAMHFTLPAEQMAVLDIINLFEQGDGHEIQFTKSGLAASDALIDGKPTNFADFLKKNKINTQLPLVADYSGAMINVSIKEVHENSVDFYAPVFDDAIYKMALPVKDYVSAFDGDTLKATNRWVFSCNCILNYLYMGLEGKQTSGVTGPFTFGEIAYQLLNQTLVYLAIEDC